MVSEPKMVTQLLDRQMYPDSIDKAPLYNMMDQASILCSYFRDQTAICSGCIILYILCSRLLPHIVQKALRR